MNLEEKAKRLESLKNESNYLYDLFVRAAHSKSGTILAKMCAVDKEIAVLKKEIRKEKRLQK